ncbi:MAG: TorF family putative porin [Alteraurantiacibacter sp.]|nr:TorF family putative porin [Alteraurantiacibacter sp.]
MLTSARSLMAATLLAGSVFVAAPAAAQEIEVSANAAIVSEYRFRGVDLSGGDIAIQGGLDFGLPSGFYVGTWASSLDETTVGYGHTELDIYGGWSGEVAPGVTIDIGALYYLYPNAPAGDFDYVEFTSSVAFEAGAAGVELGVAYAPKQDSLGGTDNFYIYSDFSLGVPNTPLSLSAHIGYTDGFLTYTANSKAWDYAVGADLALTENLSVGVSYVGAEGSSAPYDFVDDAVLFSVSASF